MNCAPAVIIVTGRDPQRFLSCGHTIYVRTHAYAAVRAGFDVHVVCLAAKARTEATAYGTVHAGVSPIATIRQNRIPTLSPVLSRMIADLATSLGRRETILHGFGVWGHAVARAHPVLAPSGVRRARLLSSYTTYLDENLSHWRGLSRESGLRAYLKYGWELARIRANVGRYERHAYR
ncbi:MAG: hypothetical protein ACREIP_08570, partial [Alphaproteobacteria bacterium]